MSKHVTIEPVLMLGSDTSLFDSTSDAFSRMQLYTRVYSSICIMVPVTSPRAEVHNGALSVYPVYARSKVSRFFSCIPTGLRIIRTCSIASIIAQDPYMLGLLALILARIAKKPFAVSIYGSDIFDVHVRSESLKTRVYAVLARFLLPRATAIQTDGPSTATFLKKKYGEKVFFKPMFPANLEELKKVQRHTTADFFKILFIGRFVPQKNIPLLLSIITDIASTAPHAVRFTIVGQGQEYDWFVRELQKRGLTDMLHTQKYASRDEIPTLLAEHDALILTSRYEGFPRVFMESAVAGLPVITTQVSGTENLIIDGESGIVLQQDTPVEVWVARILALANDRELQKQYSERIRVSFEQAYGGKTSSDYQQQLAEYMAKYI